MISRLRVEGIAAVAGVIHLVMRIFRGHGEPIDGEHSLWSLLPVMKADGSVVRVEKHDRRLGSEFAPALQPAMTPPRKSALIGRPRIERAANLHRIEHLFSVAIGNLAA